MNGGPGLSMMRSCKIACFDFYYKFMWGERSMQILIEYKCCSEMYLDLEMSLKSDDSMLEQI